MADRIERLKWWVAYHVHRLSGRCSRCREARRAAMRRHPAGRKQVDRG